VRLPLNYKLCRLYGLQSKKKLCKWLDIKDSSFFHNKNIIRNYRPYIENKNNKKRLIEVSSEKLKLVQKKILGMLKTLDYPNYLFSGLKGKSYINNAQQHSGKNYTFKIDISKFFPNTSRNKIYCFFRKKLNTSPDVASILTDCTTVDLRNYAQERHYEEILCFLKEVKIKKIAHLSTGAPTSMILSFLANQAMFEDLNAFCIKNDYVFTVYADDATFSSEAIIPYKNRCVILDITKKYGHVISKRKVKNYTLNRTKKITGVIINRKGEMRTPNKLLSKTHIKILKYKAKNIDETEINSLKGCVNVAHQIDNKFSHFKEILNSRINL